MIDLFNNFIGQLDIPQSEKLPITSNDTRLIQQCWTTLSNQEPEQKLNFLMLCNKQNNIKVVDQYLSNQPGGIQNLSFTNYDGLCLAVASHLIQDEKNETPFNNMAWQTLYLQLNTEEYNFLECLVKNLNSQHQAPDNINSHLLVDDNEETKQNNQLLVDIDTTNDFSTDDDNPRPTLFINKAKETTTGGAKKKFVTLSNNSGRQFNATVVRNPAEENAEYYGEAKVLRFMQLNPRQLNLLSPQLPKQTQDHKHTVGLVASMPDELRFDKYLKETVNNAHDTREKGMKLIIALNKAIIDMGSLGVSHGDLHIENIKIINPNDDNPHVVFFDFGLTKFNAIDIHSRKYLEDWKYMLNGGDIKRKTTTLLSKLVRSEKVKKHFPIRNTLEKCGVPQHKIDTVTSLTRSIYNQMECVAGELNHGMITKKEFDDIMKRIVDVMNSCITLIIFDNIADFDTNLRNNNDNNINNRNQYIQSNIEQLYTGDKVCKRNNQIQRTYKTLANLMKRYEEITPDSILEASGPSIVNATIQY